MKKIILLVILVFTGVLLFGQSQPITIKKIGKKGEAYEQNGKKLNLRQLSVITKPNPEAFKEIKLAKTNSTVSLVFLVPCGVIAVTSIVNSVSGFAFMDSKTSLKTLGVAAGMWFIALPFAVSSGKHTKKGVSVYNNGFKTSMQYKPDIKLGISSNGIGMKIRF